MTQVCCCPYIGYGSSCKPLNRQIERSRADPIVHELCMRDMQPLGLSGGTLYAERAGGVSISSQVVTDGMPVIQPELRPNASR
jgi:hypothetical protein